MMNTTRNITRKIALMAIAGMALATTAARATVTYNDGDLLMGFRSTNGAVTNTLLVNLGSAAFYRDQATDISSLSIGSLNADLTSAFGSGWATDTTLQWGIAGRVASAVGLNGDNLNTLYASKPEATYGTIGTAFTQKSSGLQGPPGILITTMGTQFNNNTNGWGAGANTNAIIELTTGAQDWAEYNPGITSFSYFSGLQGGSSLGASGYLTDGATALDLFRMATGSGAGSYVGSFTIDSSGSLGFYTVGIAAAPEPSRAILLFAGLGSLALRRRRSNKTAA